MTIRWRILVPSKLARGRVGERLPFLNQEMSPSMLNSVLYAVLLLDSSLSTRPEIHLQHQLLRAETVNNANTSHRHLSFPLLRGRYSSETAEEPDWDRKPERRERYVPRRRLRTAESQQMDERLKQILEDAKRREAPKKQSQRIVF